MKPSSTYSKFKQNKYKYKRLGVVSLGVAHIWSMDLAYMDKIANEISGTKYLLVAVDVLSRYLRVQPQKNKYATTVKDAFLKMIIIDDPLSIQFKIWLYQGKEFKGVFAKLCADRKN